MKEPGIYAGKHTVDLEISDKQGLFGVYNLSVIVCDCSMTSDCQTHRNAKITVAPGTIAIVFASILLLLRKKLNYYSLLYLSKSNQF